VRETVPDLQGWCQYRQHPHAVTGNKVYEDPSPKPVEAPCPVSLAHEDPMEPFLRAGKTFLKPFFDLFWINKGFLIKFAPQKPLFSRFAPLKPLFFKLASPKPL
jgi:hypothetical protein